MCGIVGRLSDRPVTEAEIGRMCDAIAHRGPDDWGSFVEGDVGLGMRRLSIVDVAGGHQPMSNEDGSVLLVFNGEIYNHEELRAPLVAQGHRFRTRSDTEALNKVGTAYKVYSAVYPALRAWTMLDHLIPFTRGYMLVAWGRKAA